jgi:hypothetical protein
MEITRQADYYGLPDNAPAGVPPAERLADILAKPTPWSGPSKVSSYQPEDDEAPMLEELLQSHHDHPEMAIFDDDAHEQRVREHLNKLRGHTAAPLESNSQAKIQQGMQNTMPEPPEPWEAPDLSNGKPITL